MTATLTADELEAMPAGARVHRADDWRCIYTRIDPPGPNGPWRRYEQGHGPVTTTSSVLARIGVQEC